MTKVQLGDEAKDTITGFKGTVIAITDWLHGCRRVAIQPKVNKAGEVPKPHEFDEPQIEVIKKKTVKRKTSTGGWKPNVTPKSLL